MTDRTACGGLQVANELYRFINEEAIPGTGINKTKFWAGVDSLDSRTREYWDLVAKRDVIQAKIDGYHKARQGQTHDHVNYKAFLQDIGYLLPEPQNVTVSTDCVDAEVATTAGPQLVVPVMNARYALADAANARWGNLYDALYGTDVISNDGDASRGLEYNPIRGEKVIAFAKTFLDENFGLESGTHATATSYKIIDCSLKIHTPSGLVGLKNPEKLVGYQGDTASPTAIVLKNHGLHVELQFDKTKPVGSSDPAGIADI